MNEAKDAGQSAPVDGTKSPDASTSRTKRAESSSSRRFLERYDASQKPVPTSDGKGDRSAPTGESSSVTSNESGRDRTGQHPPSDRPSGDRSKSRGGSGDDSKAGGQSERPGKPESQSDDGSKTEGGDGKHKDRHTPGTIIVHDLPVTKKDDQTGRTETIPTEGRTILPEVEIKESKPKELSTFDRVVRGLVDEIGKLMGEGETVQRPDVPEAGSRRQTDGEFIARWAITAGGFRGPVPGSRAVRGLLGRTGGKALEGAAKRAADQGAKDVAKQSPKATAEGTKEVAKQTGKGAATKGTAATRQAAPKKAPAPKPAPKDASRSGRPPKPPDRRARIKERLAEVENKLNSARAEAVRIRNADPKRWKHNRAKATNPIYLARAERAALRRAEANPTRTYLVEAKLVGVERNGERISTEKIAGKGRRFDTVEIDGRKVRPEEHKTRETIRDSGERPKTGPTRGRFRPKSTVGGQLAVEQRVRDHVKTNGGQYVIQGRDVVTGERKTIRVAPADLQPTGVTDYEGAFSHN